MWIVRVLYHDMHKAPFKKLKTSQSQKSGYKQSYIMIIQNAVENRSIVFLHIATICKNESCRMLQKTLGTIYHDRPASASAIGI